ILRDDGVLVLDREAEARGLTVGDRLEFGFVDGTTRPLTVLGLYERDELAGGYVVTQGLHESTGVDQFDFSVYLLANPGADPAKVRAAIEPIVVPFPNAELRSN